MSTAILLIALCFWLAVVFVTGHLAERLGRGVKRWAFLAMLVSWLAPLLLLLAGKTEDRRLAEVAADIQLRQTIEAPASPDPIAALRRLGELRDQGVLTGAEFEAKKTTLLDRI